MSYPEKLNILGEGGIIRIDLLPIVDEQGKIIIDCIPEQVIGKSAYQVAIDNGFQGTEEEWLLSLEGYTPIKGIDYFDGETQDISGKVDKVTSYSLVADSAISNIHALEADNQDLSNLVVKETGKSLVVDSEISKIHTSGSDDQDLSGLQPTDIGIVVDGGGQVLTTGIKGYRNISKSFNISGWTIIADIAGSCVIDVRKTTFTTFPTSSSIAGSEKPILSDVQKNQDISLTTWTTSLSAGDIIEFNIESVSTIKKLYLFIHLIHI